MTTLNFQEYSDDSQQNLVESLVDEAIRIYGMQAFYLPMRRDVQDSVMNDVNSATFYAAYPVQVYIRNVMGFSGQGDFLSKFGVELRDQVTFTISRIEFKRGVIDHDINYQTNRSYMQAEVMRPKEGDILFLGMNEKFYQIRFVEHEAIFYQMGRLQTFDLQCEVFAPSGESFDTHVPLIDQKASLTLQTGNTNTVTETIISDYDDSNNISFLANTVIDFNEGGVENNPFGDSSITPTTPNP